MKIRKAMWIARGRALRISIPGVLLDRRKRRLSAARLYNTHPGNPIIAFRDRDIVFQSSVMVISNRRRLSGCRLKSCRFHHFWIFRGFYCFAERIISIFIVSCYNPNKSGSKFSVKFVFISFAIHCDSWWVSRPKVKAQRVSAGLRSSRCGVTMCFDLWLLRKPWFQNP